MFIVMPEDTKVIYTQSTSWIISAVQPATVVYFYDSNFLAEQCNSNLFLWNC